MSERDQLEICGAVLLAKRGKQLEKLKLENSVLRARLAYLRAFDLQGKVRGTSVAHNHVQRGATPRPATRS